MANYKIPDDVKKDKILGDYSIIVEYNTRLTQSENQETYPTFSPDGKQIAYVLETRKVGVGTVQRIWIMDSNGKNKRLLTKDIVEKHQRQAGRPAFSPDGKEIVFVTRSVNPSSDAVSSLWIMDRDGKNMRPLKKEITGHQETPVFSPDGKKIYYGSTAKEGGAIDLKNNLFGSADWNLWVMNRDGTEHKMIYDSSTNDCAPVENALVKKIVFDSAKSGNMDVWIMDSDGKNAKPLTSEAAEDRHPRFSPDGKKIVYYSETNDRMDLWVMDTDGSHKQQISSFGKNNRWPSFSPDGTKIIYASDQSGDMDIWELSLRKEYRMP